MLISLLSSEFYIFLSLWLVVCLLHWLQVFALLILCQYFVLSESVFTSQLLAIYCSLAFLHQMLMRSWPHSHSGYLLLFLDGSTAFITLVSTFSSSFAWWECHDIMLIRRVSWGSWEECMKRGVGGNTCNVFLMGSEVWK